MDKILATQGGSGLDLKIETSTWGERLLLNLLSYSLILVPILVIVISTKYKLCPNPLQSNYLIQWFVFGKDDSSTNRYSRIHHDDNEEKSVNSPSTFIVDKKHASSQDSNSNTLGFIWCLVGLQASYLVWGYLQEKIMTTKYTVTSIRHSYQPQTVVTNEAQNTSQIVFHDSQFLVFINRIVAFVAAIFGLVYTHRKRLHQRLTTITSHRLHEHPTKSGAPLYEYIYSSLSNILSSWCQYEALKYVNFPTQCLSKSCKVIPVMLMSRLLLNKKYQLFDYACAALLAIGMFVFLLNQPITSNKHAVDHDKNVTNLIDDGISTNSSSNSILSHSRLSNQFKHLSSQVVDSSLASGVVILALYLTFDSFTSNWQQSLYTRYSISNWQMMAAINFYSILLTLTSLQQLDSLKPALKLLASSNPLLRDCILMSLMSSVGQMFVYYTIKRFGPVIFAVIMTLRQFFSILISCAIYGHTLTLGSTCGLVLVFGVVGYQTWLKSRKTSKSQPPGSSNSFKMDKL